MAVVVGLSPTLSEALAPVGDERTLVAGTGEHRVAPFLELEQADWEATVAGITAAFRAARDASAGLLGRGEHGRLVFVSTAAALRPVHGACLAATAGAFLHTLAQVAAVELSGDGITANVVAPGFLEDDRFVDATPAGRAPTPADLAGVCSFLASDAGAFVTGAVIPVDGGFSLTKAAGGSPLTR